MINQTWTWYLTQFWCISNPLPNTVIGRIHLKLARINSDFENKQFHRFSTELVGQTIAKFKRWNKRLQKIHFIIEFRDLRNFSSELLRDNFCKCKRSY